MPTIDQQARWLEPGQLVTLYELDLTAKFSAYTGNPGPILYFHDGTNPTGSNNILFRTHTYTAFPVKGEGFEWSTRGTLPRPRLSVSNFGSAVSSLLREYDDLVGATIIQRHTFSNFLDNGPDGGAPYKEFTPQIFVVDRKSAETNTAVVLELATGMDAEGILLPRRQILATACPWTYRSPECSYPQPPSMGVYPMKGIPIANRLGIPFGPSFGSATVSVLPNPFTDGVANGTTTYTSATAGFAPVDLGHGITGTGIPANTTIVARASDTSVTLSNAVPAGSSLSFTITSRGGTMVTVSASFTANDLGSYMSDSNGTGTTLPKGSRIRKVRNSTQVDLDTTAVVYGSGKTIRVGRLTGRNSGGPTWPPVVWDSTVTYSQYDTVYIMVGGIRVYAVSKVGSNTNHMVYNENYWMLDTCLKKQTDCEWRFNPQNNLPYGGFPGANKLSG